MMGDRKTVLLFDVDNTLLDNDHVIADLMRHITGRFGQEPQRRYAAIIEELRDSLGYVDYLGALQQYRREFPHQPHMLAISKYLVDYPFANRLFPASLDVLQKAGRHGLVVILTDGDVVFQPRKLERSGIAEAVDGRILLYIHKELELADVERHYPADHYVLFDDKLRILNEVKKTWGARVTTVFVRQGHYANDVAAVAKLKPADVAVKRIVDLLDYDFSTLVG
jgi:hypothetical protein